MFFPIIPLYINNNHTLNLELLELSQQLSGHNHKNRQWDSNHIDNQKPCFFTIIVSKDISNNKRDSKKQDKEYQQSMNGKPYESKMLWCSFQVNQLKTDLIYDCGEVDVISVTLDVHHGVDAMIEGVDAVCYCH